MTISYSMLPILKVVLSKENCHYEVCKYDIKVSGDKKKKKKWFELTTWKGKKNWVETIKVEKIVYLNWLMNDISAFNGNIEM